MSSLIGSTLGDYRIEALLGSGTSGQVFRASHVHLRTPVAIKVLHQKLTLGEDFKSQFIEHAQAVTALTHPCIAEIYHFGDDNGYFYLVTELVVGGSLQSGISGPSALEWNNSFWAGVDLVQLAAEGLAAIHERGLVHGGIKPTNMLLPEVGAGARVAVKLSDVGLTRLLTEILKSKDSASFNPSYWSPEQRRGLLSDRQSDLYSLGAVLYEITTRRKLVQVNPGAGGSASFSVVPPRQLLSKFPEELESIILRCLATAPDERFASSADLSRALRIVLDKVGFANADRTERHSFPAGPPPRPQPIESTVPSVQVLDARGNKVDAKPISGSGVTLGSSPGNVIILRSVDVSPKHARIDWDGRRVTVTDMGSVTSTFIGEHRLLPQVPQEWIEDQWVHIGPYWIWLDRPSSSKRPLTITDVLLDQNCRTMTLTPGKTATCSLVLVNQKTQVDHVFVSVEGIPPEWLEGATRETRLAPNEKKEIVLTINVPKDPSSLAGDRAVRIRVNSRANPAVDQGSATATWTVLPFESMSLVIERPKAGGRRMGRYNLSLHHEGNTPVSYMVSASDEEKQLEFHFSAEKALELSKLKVDLAPGSKTALKLKVNAPRRWFGDSVQCGFTVHAHAAAGGNVETAEAEFTHRALFPTWMMAVASIVLVAIVFLTIYWGKPQVPTVSVNPTEPIAGEPVDIFWQVPFGTNVQVMLNDLAITDLVPSEGSYRVSKGFQKDARIKVRVWNIFGENSKDVTVVLKPRAPFPAPVIDLTVEPLAITTGEVVNVHWRITGGVRAESSWVGAVPLDGSYSDRPEMDQTYAISAVNADNVEVKKSLTVKVGKPGIGALHFSAQNQKGVIAATHTVNQGDTIVFSWEARNVQSLKIDSVSPTQVTGSSGQKLAKFKGQGRYTFTLVATSEKGEEVRSQTIQVIVNCTLSQKLSKIAGKGCDNVLGVEWK